MIYLDNAATTGKKPLAVVKTVETALKNYCANPGRSGHILSVGVAEAVYRVREKVAEFFGSGSPERVCFTLNCTHSINCVLKGVLKCGDHVIVSSLEHNAVMRPLKKTGVSFDVAEVSFTDDNLTLLNIERKIKPNTALIFCTGASNVFGKTLPIKRIGELCRKKGILFGVDAAQTAGVVPINMKEMNIDYLCVAPHKGLYAPMGIGILICEKGISGTIIEGGTGTNSIEMRQPEEYPEKLESGTLNVPGIMGIGAGIDYVNRLGINKIYREEMLLIERLYTQLEKNPDVKLYTPRPKINSYAPVLSFNLSGKQSIDTAQMLSDNGIAVRGGLHCSPLAHSAVGTINGGTVRVSVATFNTTFDIDRLASVINNKKMKKV